MLNSELLKEPVIFHREKRETLGEVIPAFNFLISKPSDFQVEEE